MTAAKTHVLCRAIRANGARCKAHRFSLEAVHERTKRWGTARYRYCWAHLRGHPTRWKRPTWEGYP